MATLTVYADTSDGHLASQDSDYDAARSGTGFVIADTSASMGITWRIFSGDNRIQKVFVSFDTSSVDGEVTSVVFSLYDRTGVDNDDGWTEVRVRSFDWGSSIDTGDWRATNGTSVNDTLLATMARGDIPSDDYGDFTSEAAFSAAINQSGDTRFYCLISEAEASTPPTGNNGWNVYAAEESGTTSDPKLVVTYTTISIDDVTPGTFADGDTVTIDGSGFESSQGNGKVELGDSSDYGTATLVEQTVTSWSDTSIDFTVYQGALDAGTVYVFVINDSGDRTDGFEARLISVALAGSLPAFSGGLATQAFYARGVSGLLPAQTGSLGAEQALARAVSGSLTPQSGVLAAQLALARALAGELPAMNGEVASIGDLRGNLPAMNGELEGFQVAVQLAGNLPAQGGALAATLELARDLAGNLPAQGGALAVDITFRQVGLAGSLPVMSGVLVMFQSSVALEGVLSFNGDLGAPTIGLILPIPGRAASAMLIPARGTAGMLPRGRAGGPRPERGRGR